MQDTPLSIWRRPLRRRGRLLALLLLLGLGFFFVGLLGSFPLKNLSLGELIGVSLIASTVLTLAGLGMLRLFRWACAPQNLRRLIFAFSCLVTVVALFYAEEDWRGWHAWQNYRRQLMAKGEKVDLSALIPPPVPDAQNFACTPLFQKALDFTQTPNGVVWHDTNALARLQSISALVQTPQLVTLLHGDLETGSFLNLTAWAAFYRGNTNYPQAGLQASAPEVVLTALSKFAPELDELRTAAAKRPYSRFPIHYEYEPPWGILLPHLAPVRSLATLLQLRATAELAAGDSGAAFADLELGLRLSDSIHDEPILIDHLVRLATLDSTLQILREGLVRHAWTAAQLGELETQLGSLNLLSEYHQAMLGERAFCVSGLDYFRRQGFHARPWELLDTGTSSGAFGWFRIMPSGWYYQNMLTAARADERFSLAAANASQLRVFPDIARKGEQEFQSLSLGPYTALARILLPAVDKAVAKSARMQTYLDAARTACALERYRLANGGLPYTLDELAPQFIETVPHDVIDGQSLRYRPNPDGSYRLYSIGWNQTDDGGQIAWTNQSKKEVDIKQGDWVWSMSSETLASMKPANSD